MLLRFVLICCLLLPTTNCLPLAISPTCGADTSTSTDDRSDVNLHGPIEYLQLNLPQSARDERLLLAARRELASDSPTAAFDALQQVFAQQHDTFTTISHARDSRSIYQSAFDLLQHSSAAVRQQWLEHQQVSASRALQQALTSGSPAKLRNVARQFPLTAAAVQAMQLQATLAETRGHPQLAAHLRHHLQQQKPLLPPSARRLIQSATDSSHADLPSVASAAKHRTNHVNLLPPGELLWQYSEAAWRVPELAAAMGGLQLPENRSVLTRNTWQAALTDDCVLFRSPVAVSAFDKHSGKRQWALPTDTIHRDYNIKTPDLQTESARRPVHELLQMTDYSGLTVHGNTVYFLDHFRRLVDRSSVGPRQRLRRAPLLSDSDFADRHKSSASRLLAVSLKPSATVKWVAGDAAEFAYDIRPADANPATGAFAARTADRDVSAATDFANHSFLGRPLAVQGRLFVLTADREQIWLNCLNDTDGTLLWRNPLMYNDAPAGRRSRYIAIADPEPGASVCAVRHDTVLSVLQSGIVVANDIHSGHLRWAANLRGAEEVEFDPVSAADADFIRSAGTLHRPLLAEDRMLVMTAESRMLTCLQVDTGNIQWQIPRRLNHNGLLEGSVDNSIVAAHNDRVIVSGSRHVRALRLQDGEQLWATAIAHQTGIPVCDDQTCLLTLIDGTIAGIDLKTGSLQTATGSTTPTSFVGSLSADDDVYCLTTPLQISVHRRPQGDDPSNDQLAAAQQELWRGDRKAAINRLHEIVPTSAASTSSRPSQPTAATTLLSDLLLQQLRNLTEEPSTADEFVKVVEQLQRLPLSTAQLWQLHVYRGELSADATDAPLVAIDPDWRVRADVALLAESVRKVNADDAAINKLLESPRTELELMTLFGNRTLFAPLLQTAEQKEAASQTAAAEALLLAAHAFGDPTTQQSARKQLQKLRQRHRRSLIPDRPATSTGQHDTGDGTSVVTQVEFEEQLAFTTGSRFAEIIAGVRTVVDTPNWYPQKLFLVNRNLFTVSSETGAVSVPIPMPGIVQAETGPAAGGRPGLFPVVRSDRVGMVSLLHGRKPRLLWYRRIDREPSDLSALEIGPWGAGYLVVGCGSRLTCFHPLTGRTLWERSLSLHDQPSNIYQKHQRLIGNHEVVGLLGAGRQWCERFRTTDGARLDSIRLNITDDQSPIVSGAQILYQQNNRLKLLDLATETDLLAAVPPIEISGRSHAVSLNDHQAVVLTSEQTLLLLDMQSGAIEFQESIDDRLPQQEPAGLTVFERNGRLFVAVRDWGNPGTEYSASSRTGQQRIESGTLLCVDLQQKKILWHMRSRPSAWPQIAGDGTDLLLAWSMRYPARQLWQRRIPAADDEKNDFAHARSLSLQLIDGRTGRIVAEQEGLSPAEPLRVVHDGQAKRLQLFTEKSVVNIGYKTRP